MSKETLFPMNLQFFADEQPKDAPKDAPKDEQKSESRDESKDTPKDESRDEPQNVNALNEQLQSAMVEIAKLKRQADKNAAEAADYKKKYRESLSEQEQASLAKAEEQAKKEEEFETMKKTIRINDLTENFMDLGYEKALAKEAATAQVDGDTEKLLTIQKQFQEKQRKAWEQEFLKNRPEIATGNGTSTTISKEQFDKMTLMEKSKLRRENEAEYNRLLAL